MLSRPAWGAWIEMKTITPFILRRKKSDVLKDLPDKIEEIRYAGLGKEQQKLYDAEVMLLKKQLEGQSEEEFRRGKIQVLAELTRIRQICCDPALCFEEYRGGSAKREACIELNCRIRFRSAMCRMTS